MEEIQCEGRARRLAVEEVGDVEADYRVSREARDHRITLIVEYPGIVAAGAVTPARQACVDAFAASRICELDESRESSSGRLQRQRSAQRLIEVVLLPRRERRDAAYEKPEPALEKLDVPWRLRELPAG